jgi:5'(3')-deoxyribonucleotidase
VVIDYDVMHDSYMNPVSSMRKAYELLIENYDVYILAAAPTARPDKMKEVQAWAEEHINVPAWNHIVYTNQPGLVNADYLITSPDKVEAIEEQFLGTVLPIGKDELKTFEEVITFFDRLGGQ